MFNEEIVIDSLNINEKQIKTWKMNLEILEEEYENEEMEVMMN